MPPRTARDNGVGEDGTASIELIAVLPFMLFAVLVAAQLALAGEALWAAGVAARAGARADLVGRDAAKVARRGLPPSMRDGAKVGDGDGVWVRAPVPTWVPGMPRVTVTSRARLGARGG
jgi:hypothetical protein